MIIAKKKRNENIAEYILYMWQLEDLIRACNFNIPQLMENFNYPLHIKKDIQQWYEELAQSMRNEEIVVAGHLMQLKELVQDLSSLNIKLLQRKEEKEYHELFNDALPHISDMINKSNGTLKNEIDTCLTGLYGLLIMRLQKKEISDDTQQALKTFSKLLAKLSYKFHAFESGELDI